MAKEYIEILTREISEIDYLLILHIRELRIKSGLTQLQLSQKLKLADGFVSKVESLTERAKYNIRHLPLLSKALNISLESLLPKKVPIHDIIVLTLRRSSKKNIDGTNSRKKIVEVIKIEPLKLIE